MPVTRPHGPAGHASGTDLMYADTRMRHEISQLSWAPVPRDVVVPYLPLAQHVAALWPEPTNHSERFRKAGIVNFVDPDEGWHEEFEELTAAMLRALCRVGAPFQASFPCWTWMRLFRTRPSINSMVEDLIRSASDDRLNPTIIDFGAGGVTRLVTANGTPIWWLGYQDEKLLSRMIVDIAAGRKAVERHVPWERFFGP
jgi:hypothetical protein